MKQQLKKAAAGGITENPLFIMSVGIAPIMAVSTTLKNALYLGVATAVVLLISNIAVSLLKNFLGSRAKVPAYLLIISTLATCVMLFSKRVFPEIYEQIGLRINLIAVSSLILIRGFKFADKNSVGLAAVDGASMGTGYAFAASIFGLLREMFGLNSIGLFKAANVFGANYKNWSILTTVPGGLILLGFLTAFCVWAAEVIKNAYEARTVRVTREVFAEALNEPQNSDATAPQANNQQEQKSEVK